MDDAVFYQIIEEVERILKRHSWQGLHGAHSINADNIEIREGSYEADNDESRDEDLPAIFITPANTVKRPSEAGTNTNDDIVYGILCQFCDTDDSRFNRAKFRTHLRWMQDAARLFHGKDWTGLDFAGGCPVISWAQTTRVIDPQAYWKHDQFVRGTVIEVTSREPRSIQ